MFTKFISNIILKNKHKQTLQNHHYLVLIFAIFFAKLALYLSLKFAECCGPLSIQSNVNRFIFEESLWWNCTLAWYVGIANTLTANLNVLPNLITCNGFAVKMFAKKGFTGTSLLVRHSVMHLIFERKALIALFDFKSFSSKCSHYRNYAYQIFVNIFLASKKCKLTKMEMFL